MRRVILNWRFASVLAATVSAALFLPGPVAIAQYVPVFGGPTYNTSNSTGYLVYESEPSANYHQIIGNNGLSLATLGKNPNPGAGSRALRWGPSEAANELPLLGTTLTGYTNSYLFASNHANLGAGQLEVYDGQGNFQSLSPARWDLSANSIQELPQRAAGVYDAPIAINSSGMAVGGRSRWNATGSTVATLDALPADSTGTHTYAVSINNSGTAVGYGHDYSYNYSTNNRPVRWDAGGTAITQLGVLGEGAHGIKDSRASSINNAGTAVGFASKFNDQHQDLGNRAVRWNSGTTTATELGTLGESAVAGETYAVASAINSAGDIFGNGEKFDAQGNDKGPRAIRWNAGTVTAIELESLGVDLDGMGKSWLMGINDVGGAVGSAEKFVGGIDLGEHAVYWQPDGTALDLNTLIDPNSGWLLAAAHAVSDNGWITGVGLFDPDGSGPQESYGRLFTIQVPEPNAGFILMIVIITIGSHRLRDRSASL